MRSVYGGVEATKSVFGHCRNYGRTRDFGINYILLSFLFSVSIAVFIIQLEDRIVLYETSFIFNFV